MGRAHSPRVHSLSASYGSCAWGASMQARTHARTQAKQRSELAGVHAVPHFPSK